MIRRGKSEGWLQLPSEAILPWAMLNDVTFDHTVPGTAPCKGGALLAKEDLDVDRLGSNVLLTVPKEMILSLERVQEMAKADKDFREVLKSLDDFGRTPRGAILSYLLVQASASCPALSERVGVHGPFIEYVKSLPLENLPTFWTPSELKLLIGTTLAPAISAKLNSLRREYDLLCSAAESTRWYKIVQDHMDSDDWFQVDAMYRSRALDFPNIGHCMAPCIDLANHAAGEDTIAIYEKDADGDGVLLLREGKQVKEGDEVTITYGDEKGACEMLFSYGFLDESIESAEALFLSLTIPDSDVFQPAKAKIADCAPGFKLIDTRDGEIDWTGDFIWLLCVNEEDGLRFELARTLDGETEMEAFFHDKELRGGAAELRKMLAGTDLWDVYRLRAITILQQRVLDQLQLLYSTQDEVDAVPRGDGTEVRETVFQSAMTLRRLEFELMERAYEALQKEVLELAESPVVVRYLSQMNEPQQPAQSSSTVRDSQSEDDDFS